MKDTLQFIVKCCFPLTKSAQASDFPCLGPRPGVLGFQQDDCSGRSVCSHRARMQPDSLHRWASCTFRGAAKAGVGAHMDLSVFKAVLVYTGSSRTASQSYVVTPCLKKKSASSLHLFIDWVSNTNQEFQSPCPCPPLFTTQNQASLR